MANVSHSGVLFGHDIYSLRGMGLCQVVRILRLVPLHDSDAGGLTVRVEMATMSAEILLSAGPGLSAGSYLRVT